MLSPEDNLRLNVMLVNQPVAIRVNESRMTVYALLPNDKEATVKLHPSVGDDAYLKEVRELLEQHAMSGSGYPLSLKRWSRLGQTQHENLAPLLLLGEEEAIIAVIHAPNLTAEVATNAWWTMPESYNARQLLRHPNIISTPLAPVLAEHLDEFLAFETEALQMAESVCLMLQPDLLSTEQRAKLWKKAQHKNAYLLGFLWGSQDNIALDRPERADAALVQQAILGLEDNPIACFYQQLLSAAGQNFLGLAIQVLKKPNNQDIINQYLVIMADYFKTCLPIGFQAEAMDVLLQQRDICCKLEARAVLEKLPAAAKNQIDAMIILARLDYAVVRPVFSHSSAIGSLMRKKLKPITDIITEQLTLLQQPIMDD